MGSDTYLIYVIVYGLLCATSLAVGGVIAAFRPPSATIHGYIQHTAAGLVFAALGVEILPDVLHRGVPLAVAFGFATGIIFMLSIRAVSERLARGSGRAEKWTLIGVVTTDVFIDGSLIGVTSAAARGSNQQTLLVAIALSAELLSLGLSMGATLRRSGDSWIRSLRTTTLVAFSPLIGAIVGYLGGRALSSGWIEGVLAFAAAALLYLAAEELLKEAHKVPETPLSTALFFFAFLALLLVDMVSSG